MIEEQREFRKFLKTKFGLAKLDNLIAESVSGNKLKVKVDYQYS